MKFDEKGNRIRTHKTHKTKVDTGDDVVVNLESQYPNISDSIINIAFKMIDSNQSEEFRSLIKQLQSCCGTSDV